MPIQPWPLNGTYWQLYLAHGLVISRSRRLQIETKPTTLSDSAAPSTGLCTGLRLSLFWCPPFCSQNLARSAIWQPLGAFDSFLFLFFTSRYSYSFPSTDKCFGSPMSLWAFNGLVWCAIIPAMVPTLNARPRSKLVLVHRSITPWESQILPYRSALLFRWCALWLPFHPVGHGWNPSESFHRRTPVAAFRLRRCQWVTSLLVTPSKSIGDSFCVCRCWCLCLVGDLRRCRSWFLWQCRSWVLRRCQCQDFRHCRSLVLRHQTFSSADGVGHPHFQRRWMLLHQPPLLKILQVPLQTSLSWSLPSLRCSGSSDPLLRSTNYPHTVVPSTLPETFGTFYPWLPLPSGPILSPPTPSFSLGVVFASRILLTPSLVSHFLQRHTNHWCWKSTKCLARLVDPLGKH